LAHGSIQFLPHLYINTPLTLMPVSTLRGHNWRFAPMGLGLVFKKLYPLLILV
jgi:hypothetical protein